MLQVWPVIHIIDRDRAMHNAAIAWSCGCDGVFLISHFGDDDQVDDVAPHVRQVAPSLQIGVNYLTLRPTTAVRRSMHHGYAATWHDQPGITSEGLGIDAHTVRETLRGGLHRFFASVAFKGQPIDPKPAHAARRALALGFVPTTSGAGTGIAPQVEKLARMRSGIEPFDMLAVASGITPGNVAGFLPYVTHILVSTGISKDFHTFDHDKLTRLMREVADYRPNSIRSEALRAALPSQQRATEK